VIDDYAHDPHPVMREAVARAICRLNGLIDPRPWVDEVFVLLGNAVVDYLTENAPPEPTLLLSVDRASTR
jgi:hypothetical protein